MKKQTAVEWLCSQIYTIQVELEAGNNNLKNKIDQAKAMEKKQSLYSFFAGYNYEGELPVDEHEDYYKETFTEK